MVIWSIFRIWWGDLSLSHRHLIKCFFRCSPEKGLASSIASIDGAHDDTWDFVQTYFQTNRHIHHIPNSIYYIRVMANKYFPGNHDKLLSQWWSCTSSIRLNSGFSQCPLADHHLPWSRGEFDVGLSESLKVRNRPI
jgi:hypothetical protein